MNIGETRTLAVIVRNATDTDFTFSISPLTGLNCVKGGNSLTCMPTEAGIYTVTVWAAADTSKKSSATVTVAEINLQVEDPFAEEMVFVGHGTFTMGCTPEQEIYCNEDEKPAHSVTLSDFYIGKYEVTQAQWKVVMGSNSNPSHFLGDAFPVENLSWDDVKEFIVKLNDMTGKNYRLPTEAEWEYAARGGNESRGYKYSGSDNVGDVAWYNENSGDMSHAVGTKEANELGIYDMSGNVLEWVNDFYGAYSSVSQTNPQGPLSSTTGTSPFLWTRVCRGGSSIHYADSARVSNRISALQSFHFLTFGGFRLARNSY